MVLGEKHRSRLQEPMLKLVKTFVLGAPPPSDAVIRQILGLRDGHFLDSFSGHWVHLYRLLPSRLSLLLKASQAAPYLPARNPSIPERKDRSPSRPKLDRNWRSIRS